MAHHNLTLKTCKSDHIEPKLWLISAPSQRTIIKNVQSQMGDIIDGN